MHSQAVCSPWYNLVRPQETDRDSPGMDGFQDIHRLLVFPVQLCHNLHNSVFLVSIPSFLFLSGREKTLSESGGVNAHNLYPDILNTIPF